MMDSETAARYERDDPSFLEDLEKSKTAVWKAAQWLSSRGFHVTVRATIARPSADAMEEFADCGDLEIIKRVEVKQRRNLRFTSAEDYPFDTVDR